MKFNEIQKTVNDSIDKVISEILKCKYKEKEKDVLAQIFDAVESQFIEITSKMLLLEKAERRGGLLDIILIINERRILEEIEKKESKNEN